MTDRFAKFMNIWEIESNFKCPVVGAMLSVEQHKRILEKCGYDIRHMKPYEYHGQIMAKLGSENNVSIKVNNHIRNQARTCMIAVKSLPETEVRRLWREKCDDGNVGPMMYAIVAHEDSGVELLQDIHGEVHMMAHANMTGIFDARKKLAEAETRSSRLKERADREKDQARDVVKQNKALEKKIRELEARNRELEKKISQPILPPSGSAGTHSPETFRTDETDTLKREIREREDRMRKKERELRKLQLETFDLKNENRELKKELIEYVSVFQARSNPPACGSDAVCRGESCPEYRLCAKRIFMIGGMTKMQPFYREIVENAGGEFHYHDGYMRNSRMNIEAKVKSCDVILCPVNCNSHNACLMVKKMGRRYNKPVKFLNSSSLAAVTQAVFEAEETRPALN